MPDPAERRRELRLRVASACVLAPVAVLALWLGGLAWLGLAAAATAGCLVEWTGLCLRAGAGRAMLVLGWGAILLAGSALAWLRVHSGPDALFVLVAVWGSDIGAFATGRSIGGRLLAPRISPGKTWSGACGGLLASVACTATVAGFVGHDALAGAFAGAALAIAAQAGDLAESAAKRRFGVKDSGRLIPGHGGLLDRLDGLIAAAPVAAALAMTSGNGLVWGR